MHIRSFCGACSVRKPNRAVVDCRIPVPPSSAPYTYIFPGACLLSVSNGVSIFLSLLHCVEHFVTTTYL